MTADKLVNKMNDFLGLGGGETTIETNQKLSAINSALHFLLGEIDFEESIRTTIIEFDQNQLVYNLPPDFVELISLYYDNSSEPYISENQRRSWLYETPESIVKMGKTKYASAVLYAIEGNKIYISTSNIYPPQKIDNCETTEGWSALDDATNLGTTSTNKKEGSYSLKFDINVSLSPLNRASLRKNFSPSLNLKTYENRGAFTLWLYIVQTTDLSAISLNWGTDSANYYKVSVDTQGDGSPLTVGWNFLKFRWQDAITIGNPNSENISFIKLDIDYSSSFTSSSNWLLDDVKIVIYDPIVLKYYSNLVVKDNTGNYKSSISNLDDDVLVVKDELTLSTIALLAIVHYRGAPSVDKSHFQNLYQAYFSKLRTRFPPKKIFQRFGRLNPPTLR